MTADTRIFVRGYHGRAGWYRKYAELLDFENDDFRLVAHYDRRMDVEDRRGSISQQQVEDRIEIPWFLERNQAIWRPTNQRYEVAAIAFRPSSGGQERALVLLEVEANDLRRANEDLLLSRPQPRTDSDESQWTDDSRDSKQSRGTQTSSETRDSGSTQQSYDSHPSIMTHQSYESQQSQVSDWSLGGEQSHGTEQSQYSERSRASRAGYETRGRRTSRQSRRTVRSSSFSDHSEPSDSRSRTPTQVGYDDR